MVEVLESSFVVPADETPKGRLWLSNLDQVARPEYVGMVYFYKKSDSADFFSAEVLKAALSKALVLFYPLAGRHVVGSDGRAEIDCNAEGCFFVRARLERTFDRIHVRPSQELEDLFVPSVQMAGSQSILLMIQMTHLKCGAVALGFAFNHIFADAQGCFHFKRTWANITRGDLSSIIRPSFDQTPLRARSPPIVKFDHKEYPGETMRPTQTSITTAKFTLSKDQVLSLKCQCRRDSVTKISSFCAVVSLVWKCYCVAQGLAPDTTTQLRFLVDIRNRLKPPLSKHHFGNAIVCTSVQSKVSEVTSKPLEDVARSVKSAVHSVNDEYIRSLIDYLGTMKNEVPIGKELPESHLAVVSTLGMPIYDANFGWGAPHVASRWKVAGTRFVFISNEPGENGGTEVILTASSDTMNRFRKIFCEELDAHNESNSLMGTEDACKKDIGQSKQ